MSTKEVLHSNEDKVDDEKSFDNSISKKNVNNASNDVIKYNGEICNIIEVDGGDLSGERGINVAVGIGFGDRLYWG